MRKLLADQDATASLGWQLKSGTFDHLKNSNSDDRTALILSLFPSATNTNKAYVLYGCVQSGTSYGYGYITIPNLEGLIGAANESYEIYVVSGATITGTAGVYLMTSYFSGANADSVQLTSGATDNIHAIYTLQIADNALAPAGGIKICNYSDLIFLSLQTPVPLTWVAATPVSPWANYGIPFAYAVTTRGSVVLRGYLRGGTTSGTLFTMPSALYPANDQFFSITLGSSGSPIIAGIVISTAGVITVDSYGVGFPSPADLYINVEYWLN